MFDILWNEIIEKMDNNISEQTQDYQRLLSRCGNLKISPVFGQHLSSCTDRINHITYQMYDNPMGITEVTLHLKGKNGELEYCNPRGHKKIVFGIGHCMGEEHRYWFRRFR